MRNMRPALARFQPAAAAIAAAMQMIVATGAPAQAPAQTQAAPSPGMDRLFAELAEPSGDAWVRAEADIERAWSQSGSAALDYLLMRGEAALDAADPQAAIGHLTVLTENAPDFAAGWAARGAAFYFAGQPGPAASDLARALRIEPRHWPALTLLATMLNEIGRDDAALAAYRASLAINPHQQEAEDGVARLTAARQGQDA